MTHSTLSMTHIDYIDYIHYILDFLNLEITKSLMVLIGASEPIGLSILVVITPYLFSSLIIISIVNFLICYIAYYIP